MRAPYAPPPRGMLSRRRRRSPAGICGKYCVSGRLSARVRRRWWVQRCSRHSSARNNWHQRLLPVLQSDRRSAFQRGTMFGEPVLESGSLRGLRGTGQARSGRQLPAIALLPLQVSASQGRLVAVRAPHGQARVGRPRRLWAQELPLRAQGRRELGDAALRILCIHCARGPRVARFTDAHRAQAVTSFCPRRTRAACALPRLENALSAASSVADGGFEAIRRQSGGHGFRNTGMKTRLAPPGHLESISRVEGIRWY